jgi:hypothetical protein
VVDGIQVFSCRREVQGRGYDGDDGLRDIHRSSVTRVGARVLSGSRTSSAASLCIDWYTKGYELLRIAKLRPLVSLLLIRQIYDTQHGGSVPSIGSLAGPTRYHGDPVRSHGYIVVSAAFTRLCYRFARCVEKPEICVVHGARVSVAWKTNDIVLERHTLDIGRDSWVSQRLLCKARER